MKPRRGAPFFLTLLLLATGCLDDSPTTPITPEQPSEQYEATLWTAAQVEQITLGGDRAIPLIPEVPRPKVMPGYWVWDTWPVLTRDNTPARINGYYMLVSLTAPDSVLPGKRHDIATYRYMISEDGENWTDMGNLFDDGDALGSRQWAGSTIYDAGTRTLTVFYTATGFRGESELSYSQQMAQTSATLGPDPNTVRFTDWDPHKIILAPDRRWYAQSTGVDQEGIVFAFRDPSYFQDPATGLSYLTFTGRIHDAADQTYNGNIGIAVATDASLRNWRLLPPLIEAPEVNAELERPIVVILDGRYYLIISSHTFTFKPPLTGPEGMYGWTADNLFGPWEPMNGTGLMLHNPQSAPDQTYSYQLLQDRSVLMFVNFIGPEGTCGYYAGCEDDETAREQAARFGGTFAPSVLLNISGTSSSVAGVREAKLPPSM
jgi:levansucrase